MRSIRTLGPDTLGSSHEGPGIMRVRPMRARPMRSQGGPLGSGPSGPAHQCPGGNVGSRGYRAYILKQKKDTGRTYNPTRGKLVVNIGNSGKVCMTIYNYLQIINVPVLLTSLYRKELYMSMCHLIGAKTGRNMKEGQLWKRVQHSPGPSPGSFRAQGGPSRARAQALKSAQGALKRTRAQALKRAQGDP